MSYWNQSMRNDNRNDDKPPFSRVFVVCSKQTREEDLRSPFEQFGTIEDIYIPRDRNSGESKGVAYIKYTKTSYAAVAIQEMHLKTLENDNKPLKVMVAANKNDCNSGSEDRYKRLFIKVHKDATENEIRQDFLEFGPVESVRLQRDKFTEACKGFAYVQYNKFLDAAKAYEECDRKYRPMFATPKDELKRSRNSLEADSFHSSNPNISGRENFTEHHSMTRDVKKEHIISLLPSKSQDFNSISVKCYPQLPQRYLEQLFNIIPGMKQFQYTADTYGSTCKVLITYESERAAAFAVEKLNHYEFPSGEVLTVKPDKNPLNKAATELSNIVNNFKNAIDAGTPDLMQLADAIAQASTLIKVATNSRPNDTEQEQDMGFCSVQLPPPQPLADSNSMVAKRCFIVCKPQPPPSVALKDVFSRFGDLIHVSTFPNKIFGFAKYATAKSAQKAIKTLNEAIVCGVRLKVMEADEKPERPKKADEKKHSENLQNDEEDSDIDRKRMRLVDSETT